MRYFAYCDRPSRGLMNFNRIHNIRRIRRGVSRYSWRRGHILLNWGCTNINTRYHYDYVLNSPRAVTNAVNKKLCLDTLSHHIGNYAVPEYTTSYKVVNEWLEEGTEEEDTSSIVFARTKLQSSSGNGIVILIPGLHRLSDNIAPLYTKYVPTKREIRVYVGLENHSCKTSNSYLVKAKRWPNNTERSQQAQLIRSHSNGWIFGSLPAKYQNYQEVYINLGLLAVEALGLDFGAVDMIVGEAPSRPVILEVNTAPGIDSESTICWLRRFLNV